MLTIPNPTYCMLNSKNPYTFFNTYCLRTPLLPLNRVLNALQKGVVEDEYLKQYWQNTHLKEAVFLASPYLFSELELLFEGEITSVKKAEKLKQSFLKYILRASSRCTPFGMFSGVSLGHFSDTTCAELQTTKTLKRRTRLDVNYMVAISNYLEKESVIKNQLVFYPNSSLYRIADQYRYIAFEIEGLKRSYAVEGIEHSDYIETVLNEAKTGKTITDLAVTIRDETITEEEATHFIHELIDNQVLSSELELSISGTDMLSQTLVTLKQLKQCGSYIQDLLNIQRTLQKLDDTDRNTSENYKKCDPILEAFGVPYETKYVFQTDLFTTTKNNVLNKKVAHDLRRALPLLSILNKKDHNPHLEQFKKAFKERYETRKVPLAVALDIEMGVGYIQNEAISNTVSFLNDITPHQVHSSSQNFSLSEIEISIQKLMFDALKNQRYSIELKEAIFADREVSLDHLPDTLSALIEVITLNNEECVYIHSFGGSNGANLLARFCEETGELFDYVKEMTHLEQQMNPDRLLVELIHLPEARVGNVIKRPHLRAYELPYLGKSNLPLEQQININDILVFIKNNRIVLWSKKLDKAILPRLTNAHNYTKNTLPIYHFLCDLQTQNIQKKFGFSWGPLANNHSFLPRVCYKTLILSKATWIIETKKFQSLFKLDENGVDLLDLISAWRAAIQMPQYVQLKEADNTLLINLKNTTMLHLLLDSVKRKTQFIIEEFLFTEKPIVKNEENDFFTNQFVVSFYNEEKLKKAVNYAN